jgi:hypothetical protein
MFDSDERNDALNNQLQQSNAEVERKRQQLFNERINFIKSQDRKFGLPPKADVNKNEIL